MRLNLGRMLRLSRRELDELHSEAESTLGTWVATHEPMNSSFEVLGPPIRIEPRGQWIKVSFYGLVPAGQVVRDVDLAEVSRTLMYAFGFVAIDALTASAAGEEH